MGGKWKKIIVIIETIPWKFSFQTPSFRKWSHSSEMQNDALLHREDLKG